MIDPYEFWEGAKARFHDSLTARRFPPLPSDTSFKEFRRLSVNCLPAQIMAEVDERGEKMFQLHPDPAKASAKSWVWLMKVQYGWRDKLFDDFFGTPAESFYQKYAAKADADIGFQARHESLCGDETDDIAAFSMDFSKCHGRLNGCAKVIGYPQWPELEPDRPVRLFRTVKRWWDAGCAGAALIGTEAENDTWLRGCEGGIVADDVAHGTYIQKLLMRPYTGPKVLVAA